VVGRNMLPATLDDATLREAASAITGAMRAHDTTWNQLLELLASSSTRLSGDAEHLGDGSVKSARILGSALWRFSALTERLLVAALKFGITDDTDHLHAIRRFFLQPPEAYSVDELAALWQVHPGYVRDIYFDQLHAEAVADCTSIRIPWADALRETIAFNMLRPFDIERALGTDFTQVRTEMWRTIPILIQLPQFVADAIALDASIPATLALDLRIERFVTEQFASSSHRMDGSEAVLRRRLV
jgi:hypothetical protein